MLPIPASATSTVGEVKGRVIERLEEDALTRRALHVELLISGRPLEDDAVAECGATALAVISKRSVRCVRKEESGLDLQVKEQAVLLNIADGASEIGEKAFEECHSVVSLVIPSGVTTIGAFAFSSCSSLERISIPGTVTRIEYSAFHSCTALRSLMIPGSVTTIAALAFLGCSSLRNLTISDGVTEIGASAFSGCFSLLSLTIPESVTSLGFRAFSGCSSLESLTVPSLTWIGHDCFFRCRSLRRLTLPESMSLARHFPDRPTECEIRRSHVRSEVKRCLREYVLSGHEVLSDGFIHCRP